MESNKYLSVKKDVLTLSDEEKSRLLTELTELLRSKKLAAKRSILELRGLGKEIWAEIDVDKYIAENRNNTIR